MSREIIVTQYDTGNGFDQLLSLLHSDRNTAGEKYEALRLRLQRYFEWRNCESSDELADIVFDRLVKKIEDGEQIQNIEAYSVTVAQFVFKEYLRRNQNLNQLLEGAHGFPGDARTGPDLMLDCLEQCLATLDAEDRNFIISYYSTEARTLIDDRKKLAKEMNATLNTIRIRAYRLRSRLEECTLACCKKNK